MQSETYLPALIRMLLLVLGITSSVTLLAQSAPAPTNSSGAAASAAGKKLRQVYNDAPQGPARDSVAQRTLTQLVATYVRPDDLAASSAILEIASDAGLRMLKPQDLNRMIDSALLTFTRRYAPSEEQAMFVLQAGRYHLLRGRHGTGRALLDSVLSMPLATTAQRGEAHYQLGSISYYRSDYTRAAGHFENAANEYDGHPKYIINYIAQLDAAGTCAFELEQYERALSFSRRAVSAISVNRLDTASKYRFTVCTAYLNYAEALQLANKPRQARRYRALAEELAEEMGSTYANAIVNLVGGRIDTRAGNLNAAEQNLQSAYSTMVSLKLKDLSLYTQRAIVDLRRAQGRYKEALELQGSYYKTQDSVTRAQVNADIDAVSSSRKLERSLHDAELLRVEAARLSAENHSHRLRQLALWALLVLVSLGLVYAYVHYRRRHEASVALEVLVKQRTAELSEQTKMLRRSNEELERFAYIASHDLKTPLRNVTSFLNLIERRLPAEAREQVAEYLEIATANARQMHHLVTDVLEFSKIDTDLASQSKRFDIGASAQAILRRMPIEQREMVHVTGSAIVFAPPSHIEQLLGNLIENGLKYNDSLVPEVRINISTRGQRAHITVRDNGIGIAAEFQEQVFGLFKRLHTSDRYEGTGLGLAVCRKVTERLGGTLTVESTLGEGSTFVLDLPCDFTSKDAASTESLHGDAVLA